MKDNQPMNMGITPLDEWIRHKIIDDDHDPLTRPIIETYQLKKLREVFLYARDKSPFYNRLLSGIPVPGTLEEFSSVPFTFPRNVMEEGKKMLCVPQHEIERIVTLSTTGTTGASKRVFFTSDDLALTTDFFDHGMRTLVEQGETVIIFLPGERPYSVGDLLSKALIKRGVIPVIYGAINDLTKACDVILRHKGVSIVGIPTQILSLARADINKCIPKGWVKNILLSTDYVPRAITRALKEHWGCDIFTHYGMTEMGFGGGVECAAMNGYHMREADLYFEIVDPVTGKPLKDSEFGEVVFTTLTRKGMPLIRYRTGDIAGFKDAPCPCGTGLKLMARVSDRLANIVTLDKGFSLNLSELDEVIFQVNGVLNYTAEINGASGEPRLDISVYATGEKEKIEKEISFVLSADQKIRLLLESGALIPGSITFSSADWFTTGVKKRQIKDNRS